MKLLKFFEILYLLGALWIEFAHGDTHESLAKRSFTGKPYYLKDAHLTTTYQRAEIYDAVFPVVLEFTTPIWSRPINLIGYTCTGDDYDIDGWSCPILWYWLIGVRDKLQEEIYIESKKIPDESTFPTEFNCDELRQVFDGLYLNAASRSEFLSFLASPTNCQSSQTMILLPSDKYVANNIDAPYRTMREKFFTEYYSLQTPLNRSNDAMYTNARYNFYSSGLFEYYMESRRWADALVECKANRIPNTLIPPQELEQILDRVAANASVNGLELVIGINELSRYYKLSGIADCAFTPDSILVVLQIPLRSVSNKGHKFLEILPVPYFNEQGEVCIMYLPDNLEYMTNPMVQDNLVPLKELHCFQQSGFCHVKLEVEKGLSKKSCAQVIYQAEDDSEICKVKCENSKSLQLPMITKVSENRVVVFGSGQNIESQVKIVCPEFQKMEPINSSTAAVEVTLPCGCEIHKGGRSIFKAQGQSCGGEVHVIKA